MTAVERATLYGAIAILLVLAVWLARRVVGLKKQLDARLPPEADPIRYEREDTLADFLHSRRPDADE